MNNELVLKVKCFNLKYTLECGQCFRWKNIDENEYIGVIKDRVIKIRQINDTLVIKSSDYDNLENVVKEYFDLNKDYESIEKRISKIDENVKKAVKNTTGIRILNQDFFETLMSYIISANNNIPRIKKIIEKISLNYGNRIEFDGKDYYTFPTPVELAKASVEDLRRMLTWVQRYKSL